VHAADRVDRLVGQLRVTSIRRGDRDPALELPPVHLSESPLSIVQVGNQLPKSKCEDLFRPTDFFESRSRASSSNSRSVWCSKPSESEQVRSEEVEGQIKVQSGAGAADGSEEPRRVRLF
jgi:hypothetical protein